MSAYCPDLHPLPCICFVPISTALLTPIKSSGEAQNEKKEVRMTLGMKIMKVALNNNLVTSVTLPNLTTLPGHVRKLYPSWNGDGETEAALSKGIPGKETARLSNMTRAEWMRRSVVGGEIKVVVEDTPCRVLWVGKGTGFALAAVGSMVYKGHYWEPRDLRRGCHSYLFKS